MRTSYKHSMYPIPPRRPVALSAGAVFLGLVGLTCRTPPPPEPMPVDRPRAMPLDPVPLPYGRVDPVPPSPPPPPAYPDISEIPPRTGAPGSTKGTIACGAGRCFAPSEVCTWVPQSAAWGCLPVAEAPEGAPVYFGCDDASDCIGDNTCCRHFGNGVDHVVCGPRDGDCVAIVCAAEDPASCPKGQVCKNSLCVPEKPPPATCDGKKACPVDKPICYWLDTEGECITEAKAAEIADKQDGQDGASLRRCTRPADCAPGFRCCETIDNGLWKSECSLQCAPEYKIDYCETQADCPAVEEDPRTCRKARYVGQADMPPWSRRCLPSEEITPVPVPTPTLDKRPSGDAPPVSKPPNAGRKPPATPNAPAPKTAPNAPPAPAQPKPPSASPSPPKSPAPGKVK